MSGQSHQEKVMPLLLVANFRNVVGLADIQPADNRADMLTKLQRILIFLTERSQRLGKGVYPVKSIVGDADADDCIILQYVFYGVEMSFSLQVCAIKELARDKQC